jgi:L,D-transpeptidase ErfK/SrfK
MGSVFFVFGRLLCRVALLSMVFMPVALASVYPWVDTDVVGHFKTHQVRAGEDLYKIALHYDVGFKELHAANMQVDPTHLVTGTMLVVPSKYILPSVKRQGIVINLSALRLFYFDREHKRIYTYPVGIGRPGWSSPIGVMHIVQKRYKPTWFIPKTVKKDYHKDGIQLPKYIRWGKHNPLGKYALRLSKTSYLIHGTNRQAGVGRRTTAGCFSLYDKDIKQLYYKVSRGLPVHIVKENQLVGVDLYGRVWLESQEFAHDLHKVTKANKQAIKKRRKKRRSGQQLSVLKQVYHKHGRIDHWPVLAEALADEYSIPVIIGIVDHRYKRREDVR